MAFIYSKHTRQKISYDISGQVGINMKKFVIILNEDLIENKIHTLRRYSIRKDLEIPYETAKAIVEVFLDGKLEIYMTEKYFRERTKKVTKWARANGGSEITLSSIKEFMSAFFGYRDWNTFKAIIRKENIMC